MIRATLAGLACVVAASAATTKVWEISERKDFLPGTFDGASLDQEGRLRGAPALSEVVKLEDAVAWALAPAPDGGLYVGTGHDGRLYRVDRDGEAKLVWDSDELEILALARAEGGSVFAATSPKGKVYRVEPDGDAEEIFDPKQEYIWSMAADKGALWVGTGPEGKVFRVEDGHGELWVETGQRHVTALAFDGDGKLLAGTDPNGMLFRVESKGRVFTLYDADQPEVRSIAPMADGSVAFAALGGAVSLADQTTQSVTQALTFRATATASAGQAAELTPGVTATPTITAPASGQPVVSYGVETAAVFRLRPEQSVEKLWSSKQENILGLIPDPVSPDALLFLTDQSSRLHRVGLDGRSALVNQTLGKNATSLARVRDAILACTTNGGGLLQLGNSAGAGTYTTAPRDTGGLSRWGRLTWKGAGKVRFQTRAGNSARPDASWSEWSKPIEGAEGGLISSPNARYLQWRVELEAGAVVEEVRTAYLPQNRAPTIDALTVSTAAEDASDGGSSSASSGSAAAYSITVSASADGSSTSVATSTEEQKLNGGQSRKLIVAWAAQDADEDTLTAKVEFKGDGESTWKLLEEDVSETKVSVERDALADGRYRFRLTVDDSRSNPPETARTAERISEPILLDRTPPAVSVTDIDGRRRVRFRAVDTASPLTSAEYSVDAGAWRPVFSSDRLLDSKEEEFEIDVSGLASGERLVVLRVRDAAGNAGLVRAVIR